MPARELTSGVIASDHRSVVPSRNAQHAFCGSARLVPASAEPLLPSPAASESAIEAIAERVRAVISRQPGHNLTAVAQTLGLPASALRRLIEERGHVIDVTFLIDAVAALVHEAGVDPKWLLTGTYDAALHRQALWLGEDRTAAGARIIRSFVQDQFQQLSNGAMVLAPAERE